MAMCVFSLPLTIVADFAFVVAPTWHCLLHAFFSTELSYINAPKGRAADKNTKDKINAKKERPLSQV